MVKVIRGANNAKPTKPAGNFKPTRPAGNFKPTRPLGNTAKGCQKAACKWCQMGQCWDHGQIAKPGGNKPGLAGKPAVGLKFAAKPGMKLQHAAVKKLGVKPVVGKFAMRGSVGLAAKKAGINAGKKVPGCKWCLQGQCWTHGQIAKPGAPAAGKANVAMKAMPAMKVGLAVAAGKLGAAGVKKPLLKNKFAQPNKALPVKGKAKQVPAQQNAGTSNAKNELGAALQLLRGRSMTKDDWQFTFEEEKGKVVATLSLDDLPIDRTEFKGKPGADQKEAEANAAQRALNCLQNSIRQARAEKEAGKKK